MRTVKSTWAVSLLLVSDSPLTGSSFKVHAWSLHFATLVHSVMDTAFGAKRPSYSMIGTLDRRLRDSPFPPSCRPILDTAESSAASVPVELNIRRWLVLSRREISSLTTLYDERRSHNSQRFCICIGHTLHRLYKNNQGTWQSTDMFPPCWSYTGRRGG
jgi:hypothetical protein